jgi:hypothetical protein
MFASNVLLWWATAIRADGAVRWPYGAAETVRYTKPGVHETRDAPELRGGL